MQEKFTTFSAFSLVFAFSIIFGTRFARAESKLTDLSNENVRRIIDLTSHVVRHTVSITISNSGSSPAHTYQIALPESSFDRLASINVFDNAGKELDVIQRATDQHEK